MFGTKESKVKIKPVVELTKRCKKKLSPPHSYRFVEKKLSFCILIKSPPPCHRDCKGNCSRSFARNGCSFLSPSVSSSGWRQLLKSYRNCWHKLLKLLYFSPKFDLDFSLVPDISISAWHWAIPLATTISTGVRWCERHWWQGQGDY